MTKKSYTSANMISENLEFVHCNLCGKDNAKVVYPARYDLEKDVHLDVKFKSSGDERLIDQVVDCKNCGLRYVNPRLKIEKIVQGYTEGTDETFVGQAKGRERTFARQLKQISKYTKKGKVLDIGTAGGSFLSVAKSKGWEVNGIEPNKWLCEWCKEHYGITIRPGILENYTFDDKSFELVTLFDVLEHTGDPSSVLKECNRILKQEGIIAINVPDGSSLLHRIMGRRWFFYLSVHLYYFDRKSLPKMLKKNGFEVVEIKPHIQLLEIGYLLFRLQAYSKLLSKIGQKMTKLLRIEKALIPYWLGQSLFIARKRQDVQ